MACSPVRFGKHATADVTQCGIHAEGRGARVDQPAIPRGGTPTLNHTPCAWSVHPLCIPFFGEIGGSRGEYDESPGSPWAGPDQLPFRPPARPRPEGGAPVASTRPRDRPVRPASRLRTRRRPAGVHDGATAVAAGLQDQGHRLKRSWAILNRGGFPEGAHCDSFFLGGSDHVSTFAEGASCAVSAIYRRRFERAGGRAAPEALAGDRRGGRGRSERGVMRPPRLKVAPKAVASSRLTRPFPRNSSPRIPTSRCLSCAMRWRRRKALRSTYSSIASLLSRLGFTCKKVAGGHGAPACQGKARAPRLADASHARYAGAARTTCFH